MKTRILLITALAAAIVYSCSTERDEQEQAPVSQKVETEALKTNNNKNETSKVSDSIDLPDHQFSTPPSTGLDPNPDPNPNDPEIVHPGDVKPPKP